MTADGVDQEELERAWELLKGKQRDSWLLQRSMIGRGLQTVRFPRNALLSSLDVKVPRLSFFGAESDATPLVAEGFLKKPTSWTICLHNNRIPYPDFEVFHLTDIGSVEEYAEKVDYRVHLRRWQEPYIAPRSRTVASAEDLRAALQSMRRSHPRDQIVVQRQHPGMVIVSFLVTAGEVLSAVKMRSDRRPFGASAREIGEQVHPQLRSLATEALQTIPALDAGTVDILCTRSGLQEGTEATVVDIDVDPRLALRHSVGSRDLADRFLRVRAANQHVELGDYERTVRRTLSISGLVASSSITSELVEMATSLKLEVQGAVTVANADTAEVCVEGTPAAVALFSLLSIHEGLGGQTAHMVETS